MLTLNLARPGGCVCKSIHLFLQIDILELGETKEGYLDNLFDSIKHTFQEVRGLLAMSRCPFISSPALC